MPALTGRYIVDCLVSGFTVPQIANATGHEIGTIEGAIREGDLRTAASAIMLERRSKFAKIDEGLNDIELSVVERLKETMPFMTDPMKLSRVLQVVNAAKRRSLQVAEESMQGLEVVQLQLPARVTNTFVFNSQNQAVAIGNRELLSMPANQLMEGLQNGKIRAGEQGSRLKHLRSPSQEAPNEASNLPELRDII